MRFQQMYSMLALSATLLIAADPGWRGKSTQDWTEQDANQILTDSPWAKRVVATVTRRQSEDQRREAGKMGQDHGVGFDGIDDKRPSSKAAISGVIKGGDIPHSSNQALVLRLRWETALPVRLAELKAHVSEPPTLEGEGYMIAVYGVPGGGFKEDPKTLGEPLKKLASLKREGKKDVKPSSVEVFQRDDGLVIAYLFPFSAEIVARDGHFEFDAQIGRVIIAQDFDLTQMQFQGKLDL
jgi:hypothetical protein